MDLDGVAVQLSHITAPVMPDGLLLYVAHATYEPGTSPLSTWVPIRAYTEEREACAGKGPAGDAATVEGPLDVFER